mgnify:CR=1 FL=1
MEPIMHQGYINLLLIALTLLGYTTYKQARENRYLKSVVLEIKKSHAPLREHELMTTDEFWEMLRDLNIDPKVVRQENKGRRDHVE